MIKELFESLNQGTKYKTTSLNGSEFILTDGLVGPDELISTSIERGMPPIPLKFYSFSHAWIDDRFLGIDSGLYKLCSRLNILENLVPVSTESGSVLYDMMLREESNKDTTSASLADLLRSDKKVSVHAIGLSSNLPAFERVTDEFAIFFLKEDSVPTLYYFGNLVIAKDIEWSLDSDNSQRDFPPDYHYYEIGRWVVRVDTTGYLRSNIIVAFSGTGEVAHVNTMIEKVKI